MTLIARRYEHGLHRASNNAQQESFVQFPNANQDVTETAALTAARQPRSAETDSGHLRNCEDSAMRYY
eukprot:683105-Pleurochrysis_carterae.AAC.1